jgi:hypothetical protein
MIRKIPYMRRYPPDLKKLIDEGLINPPKQVERTTGATVGVDVTYILKGKDKYGWGINTLENNLERLLLAIYQDMKRYEDKYPGILFYGNVTYFRGGKQVTMGFHTGSLEIALWGPDYEVPQYDLRKHLEAIIDLKKKYPKETFAIKNIFIRAHERIKE